MRIRILSDLHLEYTPLQIKPVDTDVVVLAGDISSGLKGLEWAEQTFPDTPVIYVPGNHEFYHYEYHSILEEMRCRAAAGKVHFLENETVEIDGVRFLGCTLWSDFNLYGNAYNHAKCVRRNLLDYAAIRVSEDGVIRGLSTSDVRFFHLNSKNWLTGQLTQPDSLSTVVVTHNAPARGSIADCYVGDPVTTGFVVNLEEMIDQFQPRLWIHGHTHHSFDYYVGKTRVICNPRGYGDENRPFFASGLVVEILN